MLLDASAPAGTPGRLPLPEVAVRVGNDNDRRFPHHTAPDLPEVIGEVLGRPVLRSYCLKRLGSERIHREGWRQNDHSDHQALPLLALDGPPGRGDDRRCVRPRLPHPSGVDHTRRHTPLGRPWDLGVVDDPGPWRESGSMPADTLTLAQLLILSALIGGTIEYAQIVRRRIRLRREQAASEVTADIGLRGLVRVFLATGAEDMERLPQR